MAASWMRRSLKERWRQAAEQYRARELGSGRVHSAHVGTLLTDEPSREVSRMGSAAVIMLPCQCLNWSPVLARVEVEACAAAWPPLRGNHPHPPGPAWTRAWRA